MWGYSKEGNAVDFYLLTVKHYCGILMASLAFIFFLSASFLFGEELYTE